MWQQFPDLYTVVVVLLVLVLKVQRAMGQGFSTEGGSPVATPGPLSAALGGLTPECGAPAGCTGFAIGCGTAVGGDGARVLDDPGIAGTAGRTADDCGSFVIAPPATVAAAAF